MHEASIIKIIKRSANGTLEKMTKAGTWQEPISWPRSDPAFWTDSNLSFRDYLKYLRQFGFPNKEESALGR
jgi:hypothetical protein